jgi:hypothetical protein
MCDVVRQEIGGKLAILGFYGVAPDVEIAVGNLGSPVNLAFVAGFPAVPDAARINYTHSTVITRPDRVEVMRTAPSRLNVSASSRGFVVFGLVIPAPYPLGIYSIEVLVNGEVKLETSFRMRQASIPEVAAFGGIIPPTGRPN